MTALLTAVLVYVVIPALTIVVICADAARRERAAFDRHVEQAVGVVDDGKALVGEVEDWLRRRLR